ncbi:MAG: hypothetical protein ABI347_11575 [Nitrososphaera sp.]|jgi:hypothetical protein
MMNNKIIKNKKAWAAIAGVGFAVIAIVAVLYAYTPFGAEVIQSRGYQYQPWNATWATSHSEKIVIGKVLSVETKIVDESFTSTNTYTGEPLYNDIKTPYQFITIQVEKYLKDDTGSYPKQITFRDFGSGVAFVEGKKMFIESEDQTGYPTGERALFFIERVDGNLQSQGAIYKFVIKNDGAVQSTYWEKSGRTPEDLAKFQSEIQEIVQKLQK